MSGEDNRTSVEEIQTYAYMTVQTFLDANPGTRSLLGVNRLSVDQVAGSFAAGLLAMVVAAPHNEWRHARLYLTECANALIEGGKTAFVKQVERELVSADGNKEPPVMQNLLLSGVSAMASFLEVSLQADRQSARAK